MTDLADFLLARIAEDERAAVHAGGMMMGVEAGAHALAHINRWRTPRVLAECEAKRRIVEDCKDYLLHDEDGTGGELADRTLRLLAFPYADHPDYREAAQSGDVPDDLWWKP